MYYINCFQDLHYLSVYTVRTKSLKEFYSSMGNENKQMLYQCEAKWLSNLMLYIFRAIALHT